MVQHIFSVLFVQTRFILAAAKSSKVCFVGLITHCDCFSLNKYRKLKEVKYGVRFILSEYTHYHKNFLFVFFTLGWPILYYF